MKKIISALFFLVMGFALGVFFTPPQVSVQMSKSEPFTLTTTTFVPTSSQASLLIDFGDQFQVFSDIQLSPQDTVLRVLQNVTTQNNLELGTKEYAGLGTLVEKIGDKQNGEDKKYWQYWIGNEQPQVGADKYIVSNNDLIIWRFTTSTYE